MIGDERSATLLVQPFLLHGTPDNGGQRGSIRSTGAGQWEISTCEGVATHDFQVALILLSCETNGNTINGIDKGITHETNKYIRMHVIPKPNEPTYRSSLSHLA